MIHHRLRRRAGFTLIELMVTVAVIGILTSVGLRNYQGYQDRSNNVMVGGNVQKVNMALEQFAADNNDTYPTKAAFVATGNAYTFLNRYLDGRMPKSPWSGQTQIALPGAIPDNYLQSASGTSAITLLLSAINPTGQIPKGIVSFSPAEIGTSSNPNPPSAKNHYGVLMYDLVDAVGGRTYVLYGVGKRANEAVIVETASNLGK